MSENLTPEEVLRVFVWAKRKKSIFPTISKLIARLCIAYAEMMADYFVGAEFKPEREIWQSTLSTMRGER